MSDIVEELLPEVEETVETVAHCAHCNRRIYTEILATESGVAFRRVEGSFVQGVAKDGTLGAIYPYCAACFGEGITTLPLTYLVEKE